MLIILIVALQAEVNATDVLASSISIYLQSNIRSPRSVLGLQWILREIFFFSSWTLRCVSTS